MCCNCESSYKLYIFLLVVITDNVIILQFRIDRPYTDGLAKECQIAHFMEKMRLTELEEESQKMFVHRIVQEVDGEEEELPAK